MAAYIMNIFFQDHINCIYTAIACLILSICITDSGYKHHILHIIRLWITDQLTFLCPLKKCLFGHPFILKAVEQKRNKELRLADVQLLFSFF